MNDHDSQTSASRDVTGNTAGAPAAVSAPRHLGLPEILGLLAGDSQQPHEGERDIVASAIWRALQACSAEDLPSLSRFVQHFSHEIESRAQRARGNGLRHSVPSTTSDCASSWRMAPTWRPERSLRAQMLSSSI